MTNFYIKEDNMKSEDLVIKQKRDILKFKVSCCDYEKMQYGGFY